MISEGSDSAIKTTPTHPPSHLLTRQRQSRAAIEFMRAVILTLINGLETRLGLQQGFRLLTLRSASEPLASLASA